MTTTTTRGQWYRVGRIHFSRRRFFYTLSHPILVRRGGRTVATSDSRLRGRGFDDRLWQFAYNDSGQVVHTSAAVTKRHNLVLHCTVGRKNVPLCFWLQPWRSLSGCYAFCIPVKTWMNILRYIPPPSCTALQAWLLQLTLLQPTKYSTKPSSAYPEFSCTCRRQGPKVFPYQPCSQIFTLA